MTKESLEKCTIEELKEKVVLISASYWEHFSYAKTLSQMHSPRANSMTKEAEKIRQDWQLVAEELKSR